MKGFSTSLAVGFAALLLGGSSANAGLVSGGGLVYLDTSSGQLFAGDPTSAIYTLVGTSAQAASFGGFTDIDFTSNGNLYGLDSSGNLYQINPGNGQIIADLGSTGITNGSLVGLAGDSAGNLWAGGSNNVYLITPPSATATQVGSGGGNYTTEGDLDFIGANLYLTSVTNGIGSPVGGELFSINTSTGTGIDLGQLQDGGGNPFTSVFGVAYDTANGIFYGYDAAGTQFDINVNNPTNSAQGDVTYNVVGESGSLLGAAFAAPEPASMALIGFGMLALGLIGRKRHSA